jgi:hypothetical protein
MATMLDAVETFEESKGLINARVKIVLRRHFKEMPVDIMRGIVTDRNPNGITISGRHFQEVQSTVSGEFEEQPLSRQTKAYFIPFSSIKYIDVILPGSRAEKLADKIENNSVLESPVKEYTFTPKQSKSTGPLE